MAVHVLSVVLLSAGVALLAFLIASPAHANVTRWGCWPTWRTIALVTTFLVAASTPGSGRRRWIAHGLAVAACVALWTSDRVLGMGDGIQWRRLAVPGFIGASCPLASLANAMLVDWFGPRVLDWLAPVLGVVSTVVWMRASCRIVPDTRLHRLIAAAVWVASGNMLLFHFGYVEMTQLGIPFWILALDHLVRAYGDEEHRGRRAWHAAVHGGLAASIHLIYMAQWLAVLVACRLLVSRARGTPAILRPCLGGVVVVFALTCLVIEIRGCAWFEGNIQGGFDNDYLTPILGADGSPFTAPGLLSLEHIDWIANAIALACPLLAVVAVAVALQFARCGRRTPVPVPFVVAACGYCAYASLYSFDLGWPIDADLMLATSPGLLLFVVAAAGGLRVATVRSRLLVAAMSLGACLPTWSLAVRLVRPTDRAASQNRPEASLVCEGMSAGEAPHVVDLRGTHRARFTVGGPPRALFWLIHGRAQVAAGGHPYGGSCDVSWEGSTTEGAILHHGILDDSGRAEVELVVESQAADAPTGVQGLVLGHVVGQVAQMTAAIYLRFDD